MHEIMSRHSAMADPLTNKYSYLKSRLPLLDYGLPTLGGNLHEQFDLRNPIFIRTKEKPGRH